MIKHYEILPTPLTLDGSVVACAIRSKFPALTLPKGPFPPVLELAYAAEFLSLQMTEIDNNHYRALIAALSDNQVVISQGYKIGQLRDGFGYCTASSLTDEWVFYRGFIESGRRPAVIVQSLNVEFPRGNSKQVTPSLTKFNLPAGSYLLDAETVNDLAPTLYCL